MDLCNITTTTTNTVTASSKPLSLLHHYRQPLSTSIKTLFCFNTSTFHHSSISPSVPAASKEYSGVARCYKEDRAGVTALGDAPKLEKTVDIETSPTNTADDEVPLNGQTQELDILEKFNAQIELGDISSILLLGSGALVSLWFTLAIVGSIDSIPVFPKLMEVIGLAYTLWFSTRYLLFKEKQFEIVILEIKTEQGFTDPDNFEYYLVEELGDLLIYQDDQVFSKSISDVLPRRIICIWKPITCARKFRQGDPIWNEKYLKCDEIDTQMPLTRFDGNINNLRNQSLALKTNNFFYKVENTLNLKTSTILESLLIWPKHANVVSKRINGFARLFFAKCHKDGILQRMQICSVDFVDDKFISACIGLNYEAIAIKETGLLTPNKSSNMNIKNSSSNNNSINDIKPNNTNGNDSTLTWERENPVWISPTGLEITHITDDKCWKSDYGKANLLRTYSLNVSGKYKVDSLSQGLRYEVLSRVEVLDSAFGWESPLHLRLKLPYGSIQQNQVILDMAPTRLRQQYISFGNFVMSQHTKGDIKFSLEQLESTLKGGIVIQGVYIQPIYIDMVIPRNLSIKSHHDRRCWEWSVEHFGLAKRNIETATMREVRYFSVSGVFETGKLLFGSTYRVAFLIQLNDKCRWESPITLTLLLPNGSSQQRKTSFNEITKYIYIKVYVGEFKMSPELVGQLEFSMKNDDSNQKRGLYIYMAFIEQRPGVP